MQNLPIDFGKNLVTNVGGFGSGNKLNISKQTTSSHLLLDIRYLQKNNVLVDESVVILKWASGLSFVLSTKNEIDQTYIAISEYGQTAKTVQHILLTKTRVHLGGYRFWFICPRSNCKKRVAILYNKDKFFACRHCLGLVYQTQRLNMTDRLFAKANAIRDIMGWVPGVANRIGSKPKGMHRTKYWRLCSQYFDTVDIIIGQGLKDISKSLL